MFTLPVSLFGPRNFLAPVWLGTGSFGTGTTASVMTNMAVQPGDMIYVFCPCIGAEGTIDVGDPAGNIYSELAITNVVGNRANVNARACFISKGLPSGSVITVTYGSSGGGNLHNLAVAFAVRGVLPFSSTDVRDQSDDSGSATSATALTDSTTSPRELAIGIAAATGTISAWVPGSGWTAVESGNNSTLSWLLAWRLLEKTQSVSWAPSWGSSTTWSTGLQTFRGYN